MTEEKEGIKEKGKEMAEKVKEKGKEVAEKVKEKGKEMVDQAKEKGKELLEKGKEKLEDLKERFEEKDFQELKEDVKKYVKEHPGQAIAVTFVTGFLIGWLFHRGSRE